MATRFSAFFVLFVATLLIGGTAQAQVVVDNDDGAPGYTETGAWSTSGSTGYNGGNYRFTVAGSAGTATWTANLAEAGDYELFVWYVPGSNRATSVRYDISTAGGTQTVYVNQTGGGYTFDSLGTFTLNAGDNTITLDAAGSSGGDVVIADAVRFGGGGETLCTAGTPQQVAPGVFHTVYTCPAPLVVHVLEADLADPQYTIEMGFAQGKRNYSSKENVSTIASRYDTPPSHDVIGAVNCAYFEAGIGILGLLGSRSNLISPRSDAAGLQQHYGLQESGEGWGRSNVPVADAVARFADDAEVAIGDLNNLCAAGSIRLYTPDWGPTTASTAQGVEVTIEGVNYPLRPNKWMVGTITAVDTGPASLNNPIPANGFVLAACSGAEAQLLAHAVVGDPIEVRFGMTPLALNNARTLCTGNPWMVKNGAPFQGGGPERHPRTVIAWSGTYHWLVTFDGRQPGYSVGASIAELTDFLINTLHVDNAINLDGGGSTTMVINGALVNCPSDGATDPCTGTQRLVPNALMLVKRTTNATFPLADPFPAGGRTLSWDDKFTFNPVVAFAPTAPGGDGYVLEVMNVEGGYETTSVGAIWNADYTTEAWIYCAYRPEVAGDGYERVGIFARDDGNANFDSTSIGGGNCYALTYDSDTGRIRAGKVVEGSFSDFLASAPLYEPTSAWRQFRIDCYGSNVRFYIDGQQVAAATDTTFTRGRCGIANHEYFADNGNILGTHAEGFRAYDFLPDYDGDGDVDLDDLPYFQWCITGPALTYIPPHFCLDGDVDGDRDVDLADFAGFQWLFMGVP